MERLKLYGHYYKMFKGNRGIPEKVTVINVKDNLVMYCRGHYSKEELEEHSEICKMQCKPQAILTDISEKQKKLVEKQEKEFNKVIDREEKELQMLKYGEIEY